MILESALVLVLLVGGELGREDHCSCIIGSHLLVYTHNIIIILLVTMHGVVLIYKFSHSP